MAAAMSVPPLPPEALDLIRAGAPQPRRELPAPAAVPAPVVPMRIAAAVPVVSSPRPVEERRRSPSRVSERTPDPEIPLVQETYRLPPALLRALSRACYERRTKWLRPFTRQAIVAAALERWLQDEGYLDSTARI
jgi:hypothetical protein